VEKTETFKRGGIPENFTGGEWGASGERTRGEQVELAASREKGRSLRPGSQVGRGKALKHTATQNKKSKKKAKRTVFSGTEALEGNPSLLQGLKKTKQVETCGGTKQRRKRATTKRRHGEMDHTGTIAWGGGCFRRDIKGGMRNIASLGVLRIHNPAIKSLSKMKGGGRRHRKKTSLMER